MEEQGADQEVPLLGSLRLCGHVHQHVPGEPSCGCSCLRLAECLSWAQLSVLLQQPTQTFFENALGLPLTMTPNFEVSAHALLHGAVSGGPLSGWHTPWQVKHRYIPMCCYCSAWGARVFEKLSELAGVTILPA